VSLVVLLPQLFIQRLEPLLVVDVDPQLTVNSRSSVSIRVVYVCVEFFPDWRWNVVYTLVFYVALCIFPVIRRAAKSLGGRGGLWAPSLRVYSSGPSQ